MGCFTSIKQCIATLARHQPTSPKRRMQDVLTSATIITKKVAVSLNKKRVFLNVSKMRCSWNPPRCCTPLHLTKEGAWRPSFLFKTRDHVSNGCTPPFNRSKLREAEMVQRWQHFKRYFLGPGRYPYSYRKQGLPTMARSSVQQRVKQDIRVAIDCRYLLQPQTALYLHTQRSKMVWLPYYLAINKSNRIRVFSFFDTEDHWCE